MNTGCSGKSSNTLVFTRSIDMEGHLIKKIDPFAFPYDFLFVVDTYCVALSKTSGCYILDLDSFEPLAHFGEMGNGPDELINPAVLSIDRYNKNIWFIDFPKQTFYAYNIENMLKTGGKSEPLKKFKVESELLPSSFYVKADGTILLPTSADSSQFTLINDSGKVVETFGVTNEKDYNLPQYLFNYFYTKSLVYNPKLNVSICPFLFMDRIVRFNFTTNSVNYFYGNKYKEVKPDVVDQNLMNSVEYYSIGGARGTSKFVFAPYLGAESYSVDKEMIVNSPTEIHVFNWDAKPIAKLRFTDAVKMFDVSEDGYMYVFHDATENLIRIYKLNWEDWD